MSSTNDRVNEQIISTIQQLISLLQVMQQQQTNPAPVPVISTPEIAITSHRRAARGTKGYSTKNGRYYPRRMENGIWWYGIPTDDADNAHQQYIRRCQEME